MGLIVQKFGGSSVADAAKVENVAQRVTETYKAGNQVVVVVSAQGDTTDDLIEKANEINPNASKREMDMLAFKRRTDFHSSSCHGNRKAGLSGCITDRLAGGI